MLKVKQPSRTELIRERRRIGRLGLTVAELAEDLVEETADYKIGFLHDLGQGLREAMAGKGKRISSLQELR